MHKETRLAQTTATKIKRKMRNGNFVRDSFRKRSAKKSGHFKFFTVLLLLADLHPHKVLLFLRSRERQKCIENLGSKNMEIKVAKLTLHLINVAEIEVYGN